MNWFGMRFSHTDFCQWDQNGRVFSSTTLCLYMERKVPQIFDDYDWNFSKTKCFIERLPAQVIKTETEFVIDKCSDMTICIMPKSGQLLHNLKRVSSDEIYNCELRHIRC